VVETLNDGAMPSYPAGEQPVARPLRNDRWDSPIFLASFPLGQALSFWIISVHHYFLHPSPLDGWYDYEADAAIFGFVFWILIARAGFAIVEKLRKK
jgi:hypothetical protein